MTFLEALKAAKHRMANPQEFRRGRHGPSHFICDNLGYVGGHEYKQRVHRQLGGCFSYKEWVRLHHPETHKFMLQIEGAFQQGRLQWIDHMIAQEEAA